MGEIHFFTENIVKTPQIYYNSNSRYRKISLRILLFTECAHMSGIELSSLQALPDVILTTIL